MFFVCLFVCFFFFFFFFFDSPYAPSEIVVITYTKATQEMMWPTEPVEVPELWELYRMEK